LTAPPGLEPALADANAARPPEGRLVLHVGPHKTGSTYLQNRLLKTRETLLSHGWTYPEYGLRQFAQHRIYNWLQGNAAAAGDVTDATFGEMVSNAPRLILSSEDFVYLTADRLRRLKSLLPDWDVQVVFFIRTPVDLWPSHWQELIRHGRDDTLLEYLASFSGWTKVFEPASMNPVAQLTKFADIFGKESLKLICYDNLVQDGGDIFEIFWTHILGLAETAPPGEARIIHPSQPLHMIEMLRSLNQIFRERTGKSPGDRILAAYQTQRKTIEASAAYDGFKAAFVEHAASLRISSRQEAIRVQDRRLLNLFGDRIINKAAPDKLYAKDVFERTVPYAHRFWTDRYGFGGYVEMILAGLDMAS
jgi:hypothetical protein